MSEGLLKRYTTNLIEKLQFLCFFPLGQQARGLIVSNSFLPLIPAFCSNSQSFVVNQSNTSHCPSQEILLRPSWVKPIFIGTFGHLQQLTDYFSQFITFNLKNLPNKCSRGQNLVASSHTNLAPFPECLSPGETPGVYTARLTAKALAVLAYGSIYPPSF